MRPTVLSTLVRFWRRRSFRMRLLTPVVGLMLASLLVSTLIFASSTNHILDQILRQQTATDAAQVIEALNARSTVVQASAALLASDPHLPSALADATAESLTVLNERADLVRDRFELYIVQIYDAQRTLRVSREPADGQNRPNLLPLVNSAAPVVRMGPGGILLLSRAELPDKTGTVVTAMAVEQELQQIVTHNRLTGDVGIIVDGIKVGTRQALPFESPEGQSGGQFNHHLIFTLGDTAVPLLVTRPVTEVRRITDMALWIMGSSTLVTTLLLILVSFSVTRTMARPVQQLVLAAQKVMGEGESAQRFADAAAGLPSPEGGDELSLLTRTFQTMLTELAGLYAGLEQKVQQRTEELHRRAIQLEASVAVAQRITSLLELDPLLQAVVDLIQQRFQYYYVAIFLTEGTTATLRAYARSDAGDQAGEHCWFSLDAGQDPVFSRVLQHRQAVRLDEIAPGDPLYQDLAPRTRSELALPLEMGGTILGVLDIRSEQPYAFNDEEVPLLQSLADQVAIAIQNTARYQGEQTRRQLAETLFEVGRVLSGTLNLQEVLELILSNLARLVAYDRGSVMLRQGEILQIVAARGFPWETDLQTIQMAIEEGNVFHQVCQTQLPIALPDVLNRPDWRQHPNLPQARSWLGVPLILRHEVIGMFSLVRQTPEPYTEDQVALAMTFAGQAAVALENARLYEQTAQFNQRLEQMVQERTEALQAAYAKVERLDRTKSNFITVLSHELRTPLTTVSGYSQMLLNDETIQANPYYLQLVTGIHSGVSRLQEVVNNMLDVVKVDSRALQLERQPLSLQRLLRILCRCFEESLQERNLTLALADLRQLPPIEGDSDALRKVFQQLLLNAIKYTPDGGQITISGRVLDPGERDLAEGGVEIVISDTGIGIDRQAQELIFTKFFQTGEVLLHSTGRTKFKGGGPGLGLAIARGIVEAHHGKLWVESPGYDERRCPGSQFHVILPLRQPARSE